MSLFDGIPLDAYDTPRGPAPTPVEPPAAGNPVAAQKQQVDERPFIVTIKRASNGDEILLCNITPPPASAIEDARRRNLALFTYDEIPVMRKAAASDPRYIDHLIASRRIMGWGGLVTFTETP